MKCVCYRMFSVSSLLVFGNWKVFSFHCEIMNVNNGGIVSSSLWYFCTSEIHFLFNRCVDNVDNQHFVLANDKPQIKYDKMRQMKKRKPKNWYRIWQPYWILAILCTSERECVWPCGNRPLEWNRKSKHSCNCPWAHRWSTFGLWGPANTLCTYLNGWICAQCVVTEIRDNCRKSLPSSKHRRSVYCANEHRSCAAIRLAVCHQHEHRLILASLTHYITKRGKTVFFFFCLF